MSLLSSISGFWNGCFQSIVFILHFEWLIYKGQYGFGRDHLPELANIKPVDRIEWLWFSITKNCQYPVHGTVEGVRRPKSRNTSVRKTLLWNTGICSWLISITVQQTELCMQNRITVHFDLIIYHRDNSGNSKSTLAADVWTIIRLSRPHLTVWRLEFEIGSDLISNRTMNWLVLPCKCIHENIYR